MYKYFTKLHNNLEEFIEKAKATGVLCLDVETNSLDIFTAKWILLQIKIGEDTYIFDIQKILNEQEKDILVRIFDLLKDKKFIIHNAKYDTKVIYHNLGILLKNVHDTMLTEAMIFKGIGKVYYSLVDLAFKYCGTVITKDSIELFINYAGYVNEAMIQYGAMDVECLYNIYEQQMAEISKRKLDTTYKLEMDLLPVVVKMELRGIILDKEKWLVLEQKAKVKAEEIKKLILENIIEVLLKREWTNAFELFKTLSIPVKTKKLTIFLEGLTDINSIKENIKENFNLNSHKQLLSYLKTFVDSDVPNTNEKILKEYTEHEIVRLILDYREVNKKITTYGSAFIEKYIHPVTGKIHSDFLQLGTDTGRFSSNNPNLQNIPREQEYRECFVAKEGFKMITSDYSQQEFRLAGAISGETRIIDAYKNGADMHSATAGIIFDKPINQVTPDERNTGKTINFAVLYGSTDYGLAYNLRIPRDQATSFLEKFYEGYPTLSRFKGEMEKEILKKKYSCTLIGRKRYFEVRELFIDYRDREKYEQSIRREGFNQLVQGTGADAMKIAMINLDSNNPFGDDKFGLLMTEHDELVFEAEESIVNEASKFVEKEMNEALQQFLGEVPALVDIHIDSCWSKK